MTYFSENVDVDELKSFVLNSSGYRIVYYRGRQTTARVPHLARQAISNSTQKLHVLHIDFVTIHTEGILTLPCLKIRMLLVHGKI